MERLEELIRKESRLGIGLMSGTSADGIDAVLVRIAGCATQTRLEQLSFAFLPFDGPTRERILQLAGGDFGGAAELCRMNFLLGGLLADACEAVCAAAGVPVHEIDFVGSHGQTVWHIPVAERYLGRCLRSTLQIGEASVIAQRMGCVVVSDFRVRDVAAGGLGAPLVPYTEFILYRSDEETVALQNIGGIGNITILPRGCTLKEVYAFDTGPGNMVMDALAARLTDGRLTFDEGGRLAAMGKVNEQLLRYLLEDDYLAQQPPKTTGRERYGKGYTEALLAKARRLGVELLDVLATATRFTAECICRGIEDYCPDRPQRLIVGGGGSQNPVLMGHIRACLPQCRVLVNEDLGYDSNAKEAVAFAILANDTLFGMPNNAPGATGAAQPVVMGKITL